MFQKVGQFYSDHKGTILKTVLAVGCYVAGQHHLLGAGLKALLTFNK